MSGDEEGREAALARGESERRRGVSLAGPAVAESDDVLMAGDVFAASELQRQHLVETGDGGEVESVEELLTAGNLASRMRRSVTRRSRSSSSSSTKRSR
jgi:hypothetical protein